MVFYIKKTEIFFLFIPPSASYSNRTVSIKYLKTKLQEQIIHLMYFIVFVSIFFIEAVVCKWYRAGCFMTET